MPDANSLPVVAHSRNPRGAIKLNGAIVTGWETFSVENNAFRAADTFRVVFAVGLLPSGYGPDWFALQTGIDCEVFASEAPSDPARYAPTDADRLILGQVDDVEFDPLAGTIEITGRDWTARLIDTKTSENFLNMTSSEIATTLAGRHGLTPVVTDTSTKVGSFYSQNHMSLTQERSEWDLLSMLAQYEDFDVFVTGKELHFQPKPTSAARYAIQWRRQDAVPQANVTAMRFERSLTIASGVVVKVRSWNAKQKKAFEAAWPKDVKPTKPGQSGAANPIIYHYTIAGLTQDQAVQEARRRYDMIVRHLMKISADLPADAVLDCSMIVSVTGTGTAWDQDYYPDAVTRSLSIGEGYRMSLTAKNVTPDIEDQN